MNILFIAPYFYDYHIKIYEELSKRHNTYMFSEYPTSKIWHYFALKRVSKRFVKYLEDRYADRIFQFAKRQQINTVFIIRGYGISAKLLEMLKSWKSEISIINYQWDSVSNNPNSINLSFFCDVNFTFDYNDAVQYNWKYLPLFHVPFNDNQKVSKDIDILSVCSYQPLRMQYIEKITNMVRSKNKFVYNHIYTPRMSFIKVLLSNNDDNKTSQLKCNQLDRYEYNSLLVRSKAVLDIPHHQQSGMTMRTFETLAAGVKLITTNKLIYNSDCYNPNNILVIDSLDSLDVNQVCDFLDCPFDSHQSGLKSLPEWVDQILNCM